VSRLRLMAPKVRLVTVSGHMDLTDQIAVGSVAANPVFFWIDPTDGAPDIAAVSQRILSVNPDRKLSANTFLRHLPEVDLGIEHANMRGRHLSRLMLTAPVSNVGRELLL
jgi:hypothetical protein